MRHPRTSSEVAHAEGVRPEGLAVPVASGRGRLWPTRGSAVTSAFSAVLVVPGEGQATTQAGTFRDRPRFYGSTSYA